MKITQLFSILAASGCLACRPDDVDGDTAGISVRPDDTGSHADTDADTASLFAPFVDATLYPVAKLGDLAKASGVTTFNLGFVVSEWGSCTASWGGYYGIEQGPDSWGDAGQYFLYDEIARVRALGGDVIVSFGGAASTPLAAACTDLDQLIAEYLEVIDRLDLSRIDFDVEGAWVADDTSIHRRNLAVARLQGALAAAGRPLEVWYTLPVLPSGLTQDGIDLIANALVQGVDLAGVNVMTMDYGDSAAPNPDGHMGTYAIDAVTALRDQLDTLYRAAGTPQSDEQLWRRTAATPMIGLNDVTTETFYLADAVELGVFAHNQGIGMLSMWSVNRDHPCPESTNVQLTCSSSPDQDADWQFMQTLSRQ